MKEVTIAISGPPGSGSTTTSKLLAERLGINHFSPGRVFKDIATGKIADTFYAELFNKLCKEKELILPHMSDNDDSHGTVALWETEIGSSKELHEVIDKLQIELGKKGNIVLDGKLSLHMIKNATQKIWLHAPIKARVKRTAQRDCISEEEAHEIVLQRQKKERKEWSAIYGVDYFTQEYLATIMIDTAELSPEEIVDKILSHDSFNDKL